MILVRAGARVYRVPERCPRRDAAGRRCLWSEDHARPCRFVDEGGAA